MGDRRTSAPRTAPVAAPNAGVGWLLCFDLGKQTGWAAAGPEFRPRSPLEISSGKQVTDFASGHIALAPEDDRYRGRTLDTAVAVYGKLISTYRPAIICHEAILVWQKGGGQARVRMLSGLAAVLEIIAYRRQLRIMEADIGLWRRHFIGHGGKSDKPGCVRSCRERGYGEIESYDEADALGILDYTAAAILTKRRSGR